MVNHRKLFGTQILDTLRGQFQSSHLDVTVQVLGTGLTGNSQLSHWLAQFSLVLIGREGSCDVETAAVKRAVRTWWRPGKGCGRVGTWQGGVFWRGVGSCRLKEATMEQSLSPRVTGDNEMQEWMRLGRLCSPDNHRNTGPFSVAVEREEHGTSSGSDHSGEYQPQGHEPFLFLTSVRCSQPSI